MMTTARSPYSFRVDLHVHTRRYSPCAECLDPAQLLQHLSPTGLQGLVITEHDHLWSGDEISELNNTLPYGRIYRGVEVSSRNGHFLVIGLKQRDLPKRGIPIDALLRHIHGKDTAIIWAHPYLNYGSLAEPLSGDEMPGRIDAVEVASSVTLGENHQKAMQMAKDRGWTAVAGSDAHALGQVGFAHTLFQELPEDETALAAAIREGRCRPDYRPADRLILEKNPHAAGHQSE